MKTIYAAAMASSSTGISSLDIAILTGAFTLAAALLGFIGSGFIQAQARRREDRAQYERVISEAISAGEDLSDAVHMFVLNWGVKAFADRAFKLWREVTAHPELWMGDLFSETESWQIVLRTGIAAVNSGIFLSAGDPESNNSRYLQVVFPALQRFRTALIPLRIARDPVIADHARKLTQAADSWATNSRFHPRRDYERAHKEWAKAFNDFRTAALASLDK
jgi:hypothetical protein